MILLIAMSAVHFTGAVIHLFFSHIWGWARDLENLKNENRLSALTMNGGIAYFLGFFGTMDLLWAFDLVEKERLLIIAIIGFWVVRLAMQLFIYDMRQRLSQMFFIAFVFMIVGHTAILV